ncbi:MAG: aminoacyl-tRNA deacylase [Gemmataceae bacterium]
MTVHDYLDQQHIWYERLPHAPAYSASRMAQTLHVPGKNVAKTVLLRTDNGYVITVLPATHVLDKTRLCQVLGVQNAELASEAEMEPLFPNCERGVIPPFGSMFQLPTYVDEALTKDDEIIFEDQTHEEAIRMKYRDFEALEHPRHGTFAQHV